MNTLDVFLNKYKEKKATLKELLVFQKEIEEISSLLHTTYLDSVQEKIEKEWFENYLNLIDQANKKINEDGIEVEILKDSDNLNYKMILSSKKDSQKISKKVISCDKLALMIGKNSNLDLKSLFLSNESDIIKLNIIL